MPTTPTPPGTARSAAAVNAEIRALCAGRTAWSREDLALLARLRGEWQAAVERETVLAA